MYTDDMDLQEMTPQGAALFRKGREIFEITQQIVDLIPTDAAEVQSESGYDHEHEALNNHKAWILEEAAILYIKVSGAEAGEIYDLKMEAAAIIRKPARDLVVHCRGLEIFGFKETQYLGLIRNSVEEYRLFFIDWVNSFDQWDYITDNWGLFNPPGVGPFDKDPDDDIPFNPQDFTN